MAILKDLQALLSHPGIWLADDLAPSGDTVSTGFSELDAVLPGGGWASAGLNEIHVPHEGAGELSMLLPALAQVSGSQRWVVFVAPPYLPYAPALAQAGIDLNRYLLIRVQTLESRLWAIEQALRSGACGAVLFWSKGIDERHLRRLHLAAQEGNAMGFCFDHQAGFMERSSPLPLRMCLRPAPGAQMEVQILKRKGGPVPLCLQLSAVRAHPVLSTPLPPPRGRIGRLPAWRPSRDALAETAPVLTARMANVPLFQSQA